MPAPTLLPPGVYLLDVTWTRTGCTHVLCGIVAGAGTDGAPHHHTNREQLVVAVTPDAHSIVRRHLRGTDATGRALWSSPTLEGTDFPAPGVVLELLPEHIESQGRTWPDGAGRPTWTSYLASVRRANPGLRMRTLHLDDRPTLDRLAAVLRNGR